MTWKQLFTSSVGKKVVMALTGLFLITFLIVHVGLNACIWNATGENSDHGEMFNKAAHFMGSTIVVRIVEIGLILFIFIHSIQGLLLEANNRSKRGTGYAIDYGNRGSRWYSRSMGLLGTIILLFLIIHWVNFWIPSRFTKNISEITYPPDIKPIHNLFGLMQTTFTHLWIVILYVLGCISLGYHLAHGFLSSFRTLGLHNTRYVSLLKVMGYAFSIIVPLAFAMMPITMYLGWVK